MTMKQDLSLNKIQELGAAALSDEGGAGSLLAACMKQAAQPNAGKITKLESFIDGVL